MKGRQAAIVLGAFLGALGTQGLSADDDNRAVPRGGGSSGGGHSSSSGSSGGSGSSAGARHHSGGSDSSGGSHYSGTSRSSGRAVRAPQTDAQRRHPQPGTGRAYRQDGRYSGRYYGGSYYRSWPYDDYYWGYGYFFSPWSYPRYYGGFYGGGYYGGGYYGGGYYGRYGTPYHHRYYDRSGSVRVMVEPRDTKVYVDDYYAGVADDFDGIFQRLNLSPGRHDIALKLDGYESHKVKLYVPLDHTIKIRHKMVRGVSDRVSEQTVGDPADEARYALRPPDDDDDEAEDRYEARDRERDRDRRGDDWPGSRERGTLRLAVSPADASIYVDGMFRGTGEDLRRLNLPAGRHRLEVVRPGYRTLERDVEVQAGETEEVDVDLLKS